MPSPHLRELIRIAREDMKGLQYDVQNASHPLALRPICERMFEIMGLLLHHVIIESVENIQPPQVTTAVPPAPPPRTAPAPAAPVPVAPVPVALPRPARPVANPVADALGLPPPPSFAQPTPAIPAVPGMPSAQAQPGVANVFLTTQGTEVVAATGAKTVLPAGAAVDLAASAGLPPEPPPAPPGVEQVILPPGGGMTPEMEAALAGRSAPTS
jgi:hypothetical protein